MHLTKFFLFASSVTALPSKRAPTTFHDYGELRLTVTADYTWIWDDTGSGARRDVGLLHPTQDDTFRPFGSIVENSHGNAASGKRATLIVGLNPNQPPKDSSKPALKAPAGWTQIWNDAGSGGKYDGSVWRPTCSDGYVSLGDVASGRTSPSNRSIWCLRMDLAKQGTYNATAQWDDTGSGAKKDVSLWEVIPGSTGVNGAESIPLYTGTFRAVASHGSKPTVAAWVLSVKLPKEVTRFGARVPSVTEKTIPSKGDFYSETEEAKIMLPLTAFFHSKDERIINNLRAPFATISRSVAWYVEGVWENATEGGVTRSDDVTYGFSKEKTTNMEHTTGISMTASSGIGFVDYEVSLNYQFTYSTSTSFSEYASYNKKEEFTVPAHYATVMFCKVIRMKTTLLDGTVIYQGDNLASGQFHLSGTKLSQKRIAALNSQ